MQKLVVQSRSISYEASSAILSSRQPVHLPRWPSSLVTRSLAMSFFSMAATYILVRTLTWLPLCRRRSEKWTANDAEATQKSVCLEKVHDRSTAETGVLLWYFAKVEKLPVTNVLMQPSHSIVDTRQRIALVPWRLDSHGSCFIRLFGLTTWEDFTSLLLLVERSLLVPIPPQKSKECIVQLQTSVLHTTLKPISELYVAPYTYQQWATHHCIESREMYITLRQKTGGFGGRFGCALELWTGKYPHGHVKRSAELVLWSSSLFFVRWSRPARNLSTSNLAVGL